MRRLPVIEAWPSAIPEDGKRRSIVPADVHGRYARARRVGFGLLLLIWLMLPTVRWNGHPLVFLDVDKRQFFLFGGTFNAQDTYLLFFALTGVAFGIAVLTSLLGRVFCGWTCPQTVFLEGVFRPIERLVEGSREARRKRARKGFSLEAVARKLAKHIAFAAASLGIAHVFVSLFVSLPALGAMIIDGPARHLEVFVWVLVVAGLFYANFAFFREQLCLLVCPYGRFQASFVDEDTITVGYDEKRGEPRGKDKSSGDCVDCGRCVAVCPTGIDIRNGAQLDCIGCSACIDACDDIMARLDRAPGLVRYDSQNGLLGTRKRWWRPRLAVYGALAVAGIAAASIAFARRSGFEVTVTRPTGAAPWVLEGEQVANTLQIRVSNKRDRTANFAIQVRGPNVSSTPETLEIEVAALGVGQGVIVVSGSAGPQELVVDTKETNSGESRQAKASFLAPRERGAK